MPARLLVLVPTRGRPEKALETFRSYTQTADPNVSAIQFVIDSDDPSGPAYLAIAQTAGPAFFVQPSPGNMVAALNSAALHFATKYDYIGFVGDDHRFRTKGWDRLFVETLDREGGGLAYANDGFWRDGEIPTQIFMSSPLIKALGWMGLPTCKHLYIDNVWRVLGEGADCLFYFPDVLIEHMHPAGGKAAWDERYRAVNSEERYSEDRAAFEAWANTASVDIEKVKRALGH